MSISEKASNTPKRREAIQNRRQSVRNDTKSKNNNKIGKFLFFKLEPPEVVVRSL